MKKLLILFSIVLSFSSCDDSNEILDTLLNGQLTQEEIAEGLISALDVGLTNAVIEASGPEEGARTEEGAKGYLLNEAIKILLPQEVTDLRAKLDGGTAVPVTVAGFTLQVPLSQIYDGYKQAKGIDGDLFEDLIVAMNRGAEGAAKEAVPIFGDAIKKLTFTDALNILQGGETEATDFFFTNTNQQLTTAFSPKIDESLSMTEANAIYEKVADIVNFEYKPANSLLQGLASDAGLGVAAEIAIGLLGENAIPTLSMRNVLGLENELPATIGTYATEKAVNGLFTLIGEEEKKIRTDPLARVNEILQKVFGSPQANSAL